MIEAFVGRIGGGKTYYAVERAMKYIANGGCVCSNIEIVQPNFGDYVARNYRWEMDEKQWIFLENDSISQFHRFTPSGTKDMPSLVIVDEAHLWLNAREWNKASKELLAFLTQSRKCFTDIIFVSQDLKNMDKQISRLVQYIWRFKDMSTWKFGMFQLKWPFPQFLRIQYDYDGKTELDKELVLKNKNIYSCYKSYKLHTEFPRLQAQTKFTGRKIKTDRKKLMRLIILGLVVIGLILFFGFKLKEKIGLKFGNEKSVPSVVQGMIPGASVPVQPVKKIFNPVLEEEFRGIIEDKRGRVIITDQDTYQLGKVCRLGKVVGCFEDKVMIAGFDGKPRLILPAKIRHENVLSSPVRSVIISSNETFGQFIPANSASPR